MGCRLYFNENLNILLKKGIKERDFTAIHKCLLKTKCIYLDKTLIHEAVKSGHIDIISLFLEYGKIIRF